MWLVFPRGSLWLHKAKQLIHMLSVLPRIIISSIYKKNKKDYLFFKTARLEDCWCYLPFTCNPLLLQHKFLLIFSKGKTILHHESLLKVPKLHEDWHWHSPFFHVLIVWVVRWGGVEVPAVSKALIRRLQPRQHVDAITWCADRALKLHAFYCVEVSESNFGGHCPLGCLYQWEFCHFSQPREQDPSCSKILTPKIKGKRGGKSTQVFICVLVWMQAAQKHARIHMHTHTHNENHLFWSQNIKSTYGPLVDLPLISLCHVCFYPDLWTQTGKWKHVHTTHTYTAQYYSDSRS